MADIASNLSDKAILHLIIQEMKTRSYYEMEVCCQNYNKTLSNRRKQAIKLRFSPNDIIHCGKGHETYQEINGVRHHLMIWKQ
jgi:UDP-N-acetylmuramoyl-L-alanyl-D-glutamate--2,6-diaminopimelate ligase